jgi:hypothetical protein
LHHIKEKQSKNYRKQMQNEIKIVVVNLKSTLMCGGACQQVR